MAKTQQGTTTTATAPSWQLPYQQYGENQALSQYNSINSPSQLVSPFSQQQNQAISNISNLANGGSAPMNAATSYTSNVLNGQPANNPYLSSEFNLAANDVQNRLSSEFANSGRNVVGSMPVQADQLNNLATQLYGGAYQTGVQQQENALGNAVPLAQQQLSTQNQLFGAGQQIQNLGQQYIQAPQQFLQNYLNQTNQIPGQSTTTTGQVNPLMGALGGATLGSSIGNTLGGGNSQMGSLLGTLGGGLLGAFG